jgi:hypothetical protein
MKPLLSTILNVLGSETDQELQWLGETINAYTVLVMNSLGNNFFSVQVTAL